MPIAREGWPLILVPLGLAVVLFLLRWPWTGGVLLLLGLLDARPLRRLFRERLASLCDAGHC